MGTHWIGGRRGPNQVCGGVNILGIEMINRCPDDRIDEKCRHPIMVADPMKLWQKYHIAKNISDALEALGDSPGASKVIAGGTDLLLDLQQDRHPPVHTIVDITQIPEMTSVVIWEDELFIGAAVTHRFILNSPLIREHCTALAEAADKVGGPQVRNTATIGGNIAHALPAADGTIALTALDARVEIASKAGTNRVPLLEIFEGPGISSLDPKSEILTGIYIPLRKSRQSSAFKRIMRPQGVAIAILNIAVWLYREENRLKDVRVAIGPSGPVPRRMLSAENVLRGRNLSSELIDEAHIAILGETNFRTSRYRATKEYRQKMSKVLLKAALETAYSRTLQEEFLRNHYR